MSPRSKLILRLAFAALLAGACGWFAWHQDWAGVLAVARGASPWGLLAAMLLNVPLVWMKARRVQILLSPTVAVTRARLMRMFFASYAADNLLMSQAGLGVRVAMVRAEGVPWTTATALQGLEKALEAMGLALVGVVVELAPPPGLAWLAGALRVTFGLAIGAAVIAVALVLAGGLSSTHRWTALLRRIGDSAAALRRPLAAAEIVMWTAMAWAVELLMVALALAALGLPHAVGGVALVVLAVNIAALVPGLPGNVGTFEASAVLALAAVGVARPAALGFALLFHMLHTIPVTLVGLPALRAGDWSKLAERPAPIVSDTIAGPPS